MKFFKILALSAITAISVVLSGCGTATVDEEYSFGYTQMKSAESEIFLLTPFQLGRVKSQIPSGFMYIGSDNHINIIATAEPAATTPPQAAAEHAAAMLKQTPDITDLQTKTSATTVSGRNAVVIDSTYDEPVDGKKMALVVRSVFFEDKGQTWNVMYMYPKGDAIGEEVTERIFGQLQ
ncbi:hypothetical protein [Megasphaera vaginalis (ex Srinivasan et al. 2021)]|nr:hypothetical protein [Megasphaera vaginalis (ex Srinivasan et al. 2021)]